METRQITCRTLPVKRSQGQSSVAGASYRAGVKLWDDRLEKTINYEARQPDIWHTEILVPEGAPDWTQDRERLWNAAEAAERRKDGRPARDVTLGLPWGMSQSEHEEAARSFAQKEFVDKDHIVDLCFHRYGSRVTDVSDAGRDTLRRWAARDIPFLERGECENLHEPHVKIERNADNTVVGYKIFQPHAHAYVTPRAIDADGFSSQRNRQFDRAEQAKEWRYEWGHHINERLEATGRDFRVSALAPEGDADLPLKPEDMPLQSYHIEQEGQKSVLREERTFNGVHNNAIRTADATRRLDTTIASEDARSGRNSRFERFQAWANNMRNHFSEWRTQLQERAEVWWSRWQSDASEEELQKTEPNAEPSNSSCSEEHDHDHYAREVEISEQTQIEDTEHER